MLRVKNYNIKEMNIRSYSNNNTALELVCEDGTPLAIITVNLGDLLKKIWLILTPIIVLGLKTF